MIMYILYFCVCIYYLNSRNKEKKTEIVEENLEFIPVILLDGAKEGYVFKIGDIIGYYIVYYYMITILIRDYQTEFD